MGKRFCELLGAWWPRLADVAVVVFVVLLLLCSCSTAKTAARVREMDSVAVKYQTVRKDSVVVRDSVRWVTRTAIRDSVVVRVDAATGEVVGRDSWHWRDTDNSRAHVSAVRESAEKGDSLVSEAVLRRDSMVVPLKTKNGSEGRKTGWKWFLWGIGCGIGVCAVWKWRRFVLRMI